MDFSSFISSTNTFLLFKNHILWILWIIAHALSSSMNQTIVDMSVIMPCERDYTCAQTVLSFESFFLFYSLYKLIVASISLHILQSSLRYTYMFKISVIFSQFFEIISPMVWSLWPFSICLNHIHSIVVKLRCLRGAGEEDMRGLLAVIRRQLGLNCAGWRK